MGTSAVVSSAEVAANRYTAQVEPAESDATASSLTGRMSLPGFSNVEDVLLDPGNPESDAHPNIVKAKFDGGSNGEGKGEVRYIVHAEGGTTTFAFKLEAEARAFVSYASASANKGSGAAIGQSTELGMRSKQLTGATMLKAAGYHGNLRVALKDDFEGFENTPQVTINGENRLVFEMKEGFTQTMLNYDYSEFAGTGIPSLPSEAVGYLRNTFKTIPTDPAEFQLQFAGLAASAHSIFEHNGYDKGDYVSLDAKANPEISRLIQRVFVASPDAGKLNALRLMGLATAGEGGADNFESWTLTKKGKEILGALDNFMKEGTLYNMNFLPSLALANVESSKQFITGSRLNTFIDAATSPPAFKAKADGSGNYTPADVQAHLSSQYDLLQPDLGNTPPVPLRDSLKRGDGVAATTLLTAVFGTSALDESHVNVAISAGLLTAGADANSGTTSISTTALGDWLMTHTTTPAAAPA